MCQICSALEKVLGLGFHLFILYVLMVVLQPHDRISPSTAVFILSLHILHSLQHLLTKSYDECLRHPTA